MLNDVEPTPIPYWQSSGWDRSQPKEGIELYRGTYKVVLGEEQKEYGGYVLVQKSPSYSTGDISVEGQTEAKGFIEDPPEEVQNHPHGSWLGRVGEFNEKGKTKFILHFTKPPRDADTAIKFMERMLDESFHPQSKNP